MSQDYDSDGYMERATAVLAAAYAINSLEESKKIPQPSRTRFKSKKDDVIIPGPESDHEYSTWETPKYDFISDDEIREEEDSYAKFAPEKSVNVPAPTIIKPPSFAPRTPPRESGNSHSIDHDGEIMPEKAVARAPSFKRTTSFPSKRFDGSKSEIEAPKQDMPTLKPESSAPKTDYMPPTIKPRTRPSMEETEADAWEKAELAKINERYDKVKTTIQKWEDKKQEEAKRKLNEREQSELEQTRVKARQRYHSAIESINQIAGGAKAQSEERRRNEEMKAKEKANIIRTTGKVPKTCCFCF